MKKKITLIFLFATLMLSLTTSPVKGAIDCPSAEMLCVEITSAGGCAATCEKTLTQKDNPRKDGDTSRCKCETSQEDGAQGDVDSKANSGYKVGCNGNVANGINTALGCVPIDQNGFANWLLSWSIGIAGGIAFILILIAGFQIMTSSGDPKKLQAGKELLTSAIGGVLLLIFAIVILRIIGVDILKIPGFSAN